MGSVELASDSHFQQEPSNLGYPAHKHNKGCPTQCLNEKPRTLRRLPHLKCVPTPQAKHRRQPNRREFWALGVLPGWREKAEYDAHEAGKAREPVNVVLWAVHASSGPAAEAI